MGFSFLQRSWKSIYSLLQRHFFMMRFAKEQGVQHTSSMKRRAQRHDGRRGGRHHGLLFLIGALPDTEYYFTRNDSIYMSQILDSQYICLAMTDLRSVKEIDNPNDTLIVNSIGTVTVPAGTFYNCYQISFKNETWDYIFAPNVGWIKSNSFGITLDSAIINGVLIK
jgi:hypothetical protein